MLQVSRTLEPIHFIKPYYQHGYGSRSIGEPDWRPHPRNALSHPDALHHTRLGGNGQDWYSSIRCPSPLPPRERIQATATDVQNEKEIPSRKQSLQRRSRSRSEPIVCSKHHDDGEYHYTRPIELTLQMAVGAKKKVYCRRNGLTAASLGDKSYQVPEYSGNFHQHGSTLPVVSFGGVMKSIPDTFIPLQDLPLKPRQTFKEKIRKQQKVREVQDVVKLDMWKPAPKLVPSFQLPLSTSHF